MDSRDRKLEKKSRQDYRRAVDRIVTNQVQTIMKNLKTQRNIFGIIVVFSVPLNIVLAILLILMWSK